MSSERRAESPWIAVLLGFFLILIGGGGMTAVLTENNPSGLVIGMLGLIAVAGWVALLVGCIAAGVEWGNRRTS